MTECNEQCNVCVFVWVGKEKKRKGWETCRCYRGHPGFDLALCIACISSWNVALCSGYLVVIVW